MSVLFVGACASAAPRAQTTAAAGTVKADTSAPAHTDKAIIKDPSMHGMKAMEVTYPAEWHFKGDLYLAGVRGPYTDFKVQDCVSAPTGVFRATSPDGLSFVEQWPVAAWGWASGVDGDWYAGKSCFPLHGPTEAQLFLKYLAAMLGVEYLADEPADAAEKARLEKMAQDANAQSAATKPGEKLPTMHWKVEMAEAMVGFSNGTFKMKGRLTTEVACSATTYPDGLGFSGKKGSKTAAVIDRCVARVVYLVAPEDQLAGLIVQWDRPGMGPRRLDEWEQARAAALRADVEKTSDPNGFIRSEAMLSWKRDFSHTQAVREKMYEEFAGTMAAGMERMLGVVGHAGHTIAPDWVDLQLDADLVDSREGEGTGGVISIPRNTWTDSAGKNKFEAWDLDANPNGILAGTWIGKQSLASERVESRPQ
jgi:hypothetical protein